MKAQQPDSITIGQSSRRLWIQFYLARVDQYLYNMSSDRCLSALFTVLRWGCTREDSKSFGITTMCYASESGNGGNTDSGRGAAIKITSEELPLNIQRPSNPRIEQQVSFRSAWSLKSGIELSEERALAIPPTNVGGMIHHSVADILSELW